MKTLKIRFSADNALEISKLLYSLDIDILISWSVEDFGDVDIYCIIKVDRQSAIPENLRMEKIQEHKQIKIYK